LLPDSVAAAISNPGPTAPESSTLTTRLPSNPLLELVLFLQYYATCVTSLLQTTSAFLQRPAREDGDPTASGSGSCTRNDDTAGRFVASNNNNNDDNTPSAAAAGGVGMHAGGYGVATPVIQMTAKSRYCHHSYYTPRTAGCEGQVALLIIVLVRPSFYSALRLAIVQFRSPFTLTEFVWPPGQASHCSPSFLST